MVRILAASLMSPSKLSLLNTSVGTVGIYFRALSRFVPPIPAPKVMSISVDVGKENGSMRDGSIVRRVEGGSVSGSICWAIDGEGGGRVEAGDSGTASFGVPFWGVVDPCGVMAPSLGAGVTGLWMSRSCPFCSCARNFMCAFGRLVSPTSDR